MVALTVADRSVPVREGAPKLVAACATVARDGMVVETESAGEGAFQVFVPFHFRAAVANLLTNPALDPHAKLPSFKVRAMRIEKAD